MVKHTQKIRRQNPTNCLGVLHHFVKLAFKGLRSLSGIARLVVVTRLVTMSLRKFSSL